MTSSSSSFALFKFRQSTGTVVNEGRNLIYDNILECDRKLLCLDTKESKLRKEGLEAKKKRQNTKFLEITRQLKALQVERKGYVTRKATLQRQLTPLENSKRRLDDIKTAKAITTANRRIMGEIGGIPGMIDLQRSMEQTTMEMEDGVGEIIDNMFEPEDGLSDEEDVLDNDEIEKIWDDYQEEEAEDGGMKEVFKVKKEEKIPTSSIPSASAIDDDNDDGSGGQSVIEDLNLRFIDLLPAVPSQVVLSSVKTKESEVDLSELTKPVLAVMPGRKR